MSISLCLAFVVGLGTMSCWLYETLICIFLDAIIQHLWSVILINIYCCYFTDGTTILTENTKMFLRINLVFCHKGRLALFFAKKSIFLSHSMYVSCTILSVWNAHLSCISLYYLLHKLILLLPLIVTLFLLNTTISLYISHYF